MWLIKYLLLLLLVTGCSTPRGYSNWDKQLPTPEYVHGDSVESIVKDIYSQFHYKKDLTNEWFIPKKEGRLGYQGDCEDFALLVASHLKPLGINTKMLVLVRSSKNWKSNKPAVKRHAMLLLPDGRYVDNQHDAPFTDLGPYRIEWTSDDL